jgi:hypothetical protein
MSVADPTRTSARGACVGLSSGRSVGGASRAIKIQNDSCQSVGLTGHSCGRLSVQQTDHGGKPVFNVRRREFITLLGSGAVTWPLAAAGPGVAQQPTKISRVGVLTPAATDATPAFQAFRKGIRDLGYVEGQTIVLDFRFARGNLDALPSLAAELVRIPVDVIVTDSTNGTVSQAK